MSDRTPLHAASLRALLAHPQVWRVENPDSLQTTVWPTGFATLDACLPGGGWPVGGLIEILHDDDGIGELSLLLPVLTQLSGEGRLIACIAPPYVPCVAALSARGISTARMLVVDVTARDEIFWAAEQALRSGACGGVLMWSYTLSARDAQRDERAPATDGISFTALRRLQLAAESGAALGVIFRRRRAAQATSAASLRLAVRAHDDTLQVTLLKARGGRPRRVCISRAALGLR